MAVWQWTIWITSRRSTESWSSNSVTRTGSAAFIPPFCCSPQLLIKYRYQLQADTFCRYMHTSRYVITSYKCSIVLQTIKQLQQRLAELKRTLQKELVRHSESHQCFLVFFCSDNTSANWTVGDEAALFFRASHVIWNRGVQCMCFYSGAPHWWRTVVSSAVYFTSWLKAY